MVSGSVGGTKPSVGAASLASVGRRDEIGRHHHDQFGFVVLEIAAAEQRAQDRHVLEAGKRVDLLLGGVLHQPGDGEAAAGRQFDRGLRPAHRQAREWSAPQP